MIGLFYRLKIRKNAFFKVIIVLSLLSMCSLTVILLPQILSPSNLSKYLGHLTNQHITTHDMSHLIVDNEIYTISRRLNHVNNFSSCIEDASLNTFGIYSPYSIGYVNFIALEVIININESYFTKLLGVADNDYTLILNYCENNTLSNGAIICTENASDSLDLYSVKINNILTALPVNNLCLISTLKNNFPNTFDLYNSTSFGELGNRFFIMSASEIENLYQSIIISDYGSFYSLYGYLNFTQTQRDIMYWSPNSYELITNFRSELNSSLISIEPTIKISFDINNRDLKQAENNHFVVSLAFSIIQFSQIIIWFLSFLFIFISITSFQKEMENNELVELFSGQKWGKRIGNHLLESLIIIFTSLFFACIGLILFLPLQLLIGFNFKLTFEILVPFFIFITSYFTTIFIAYIDFELFLRKKTHSSINQIQKYRPLITWPWYVKILLSFIPLLFLWLISYTLTIFLFLLIFIFLAIVMTCIIVLLIKLISSAITKIAIHIKRRKNKPLSKIYFLWVLWKKTILRKTSLSIFLLSLLLGGILFCSFSADILRTQAIWTLGSDISTKIQKNFSTEFESSIENNTNIINYCKTFRSLAHFNSSNTMQIYIAKEQINIDDEFIQIVGIDRESYFSFYNNWQLRYWLSEGLINSFDNTSVFISKRLKELTKTNIGDSIILSTNISQRMLTIKGIINIWPTVTGYWDDSSNEQGILIADFNLLDQLYLESDLFVSYGYQIDVKKDKELETVNYLKQVELNLGYFEEISYLDPMIYKGIWQIFILPLIVAFQLLILLFFAIFVINSLSERLSSPIAKALGLLAQNQDYKLTFIRFKVMELSIIIIINLLLFPLIYLLTLGYYSIETTLVIPSIYSYVSTSNQTIIYSVTMFILFIFLVLIQFSYDLIVYRRINLSLIYRYPE